MDYKKEYTKQTKRSPYCCNDKGEYITNFSYSDDYVMWLECLLTQETKEKNNGVVSKSLIDFIKLYKIFKTDSGRIWKIDTIIVPKEDVSNWIDTGVFVTKNGLRKLSINV